MDISTQNNHPYICIPLTINGIINPIHIYMHKKLCKLSHPLVNPGAFSTHNITTSLHYPSVPRPCSLFSSLSLYFPLNSHVSKFVDHLFNHIITCHALIKIKIKSITKFLL